jgi:hypothetical protein
MKQATGGMGWDEMLETQQERIKNFLKRPTCMFHAS